MDIKEIRTKYPEYKDLSDNDLARGLHKKFYPDMPAVEFGKKIGLEVPTSKTPEPSMVKELVNVGEGIAEGSASVISGMVGGAAGGVAGLVDLARTGGDLESASGAINAVAEAVKLQPATPVGQAIDKAIAYPFEKLAEGGKYLGGKTLEKTGSPALAAGVESAVTLAPIAFGLGAKYGPRATAKVFGKIKDMKVRREAMKAYRALPPEQQAPALYSLDAAIKANPSLTEAQVIRKWPQFKAEIMEKHGLNRGETAGAAGEGFASPSPSKPAAPQRPAAAPAVDPVKAAPVEGNALATAVKGVKGLDTTSATAGLPTYPKVAGEGFIMPPGKGRGLTDLARNNKPELADGRFVDVLKERGFEIVGDRVAAGSLKNGDQVVLKDGAEVFTVEEVKGGLTLKGRTNRAVNLSDGLDVTAVKHGEALPDNTNNDIVNNLERRNLDTQGERVERRVEDPDGVQIEIRAERNKPLTRFLDRQALRHRDLAGATPEAQARLKSSLKDDLLGDYGVTDFPDARNAMQELHDNGTPFIIERSDGGNLGGFNEVHGGDHAAANVDIRKIWGDIYVKEVREHGGIVARDQGDEIIAVWPNYSLAEVEQIRADIETRVRAQRDELGYGETMHKTRRLPTGAGHINYGLSEVKNGDFKAAEKAADLLQQAQKEAEQVAIANKRGYILDKESKQYVKQEIQQEAQPTEEGGATGTVELSSGPERVAGSAADSAGSPKGSTNEVGPIKALPGKKATTTEISSMAADLIKSADAAAINAKLDKVFNLTEDQAQAIEVKLDTLDGYQEPIEFTLANDYRADIEYAAKVRDTDEVKSLLTFLSRDTRNLAARRRSSATRDVHTPESLPDQLPTPAVKEVKTPSNKETLDELAGSTDIVKDTTPKPLDVKAEFKSRKKKAPAKQTAKQEDSDPLVKAYRKVELKQAAAHDRKSINNYITKYIKPLSERLQGKGWVAPKDAIVGAYEGMTARPEVMVRRDLDRLHNMGLVERAFDSAEKPFYAVKGTVIPEHLTEIEGGVKLAKAKPKKEKQPLEAKTEFKDRKKKEKSPSKSKSETLPPEEEKFHTKMQEVIAKKLKGIDKKGKTSKDTSTKTSEKKGLYEGETLLHAGLPFPEFMKLLKKFKSEIPDRDASLIDKYTAIPTWMADKHPELKGLQKVMNDRFRNRNMIRHEFTKDLFDSWSTLTPEMIENVGEKLWKGDRIKSVLNQEALDKLHPAEFKAYTKVREILDYIRDVDIPELFKELGGTKSQVEDYRREIGRIKGYMPHDRDGRFYARALEGDKVMWREHFDDIVKTVSGGKLGVKEKFIRRRLEKEFPGKEIDFGKNAKPVSESTYFDASARASEEVIGAALKMSGKEGDEAFRDALLSALADVFKVRGFMSHGLTRAGTPGFDKTNWQDSLMRYVGAWSGFKSKALAMRDIRNAWSKVDWEGKDRLHDYMDTFIRDSFENQTAVDRAIDNTRGWLFRKFLWGNLKSATINMTQNYLATIPMLSMESGWPGAKVQQAMNQAGMDIIKTMPGNPAKWNQRLKDQQGKRLTEEEHRGLNRARLNGIVGDQLTQELMGMKLGKYGSPFRKIDNALTFPFGAAEIFNRETAYVAAFRIAKEKGMNFEEAADWTENIIDQTHFRYGRENMPPFARGNMKIGRALYAFRHYTRNMLHAWEKMYRTGGPAGKKAFARSMASLVLMGGVSSLPGIAIVGAIYQKITGEDLMENITKLAGEYSRWFMYGLPEMIGVDFSGSLGTDIPADPWEVVGAVGSIYKDTAKTVEDLSDRDYQRALEDAPITPAVIKNPLVAYRYATRGVETRSGKKRLDEEGEEVKLTGFDIGKKALGYQPTKISEFYRKGESRWQNRTFWNNKRDKIVTRLVKASSLHGMDSPEFERAMEEAYEFNEKAPVLVPMISSSTFRKASSSKGLTRREMQHEAGE